jgi:hypothetical protein
MSVWAESMEELGDAMEFVHHTNGTLEQIILRPSGTRMLLPLNLNRRRSLLPRKSLDCSPSIDLYFSLALWFYFFLLAVFCDLYIFVSLEEFWLLLVTIANIWHAFLCMVNSTTLGFLKWDYFQLPRAFCMYENQDKYTNKGSNIVEVFT